MFKILLVFLFFCIIASIILMASYMKELEEKKIEEISIKKETNNDRLKIGFKYISNLSKLDSILKELKDNKCDNNKIKYMKKIINDLNKNIYGNKIYKKSIYYENEYLYKKDIINLEVILYAFEKLFSNDNTLNISDESYDKQIKNIKKKSFKVLKKKKNKIVYYNAIEDIKKDYKNLIDESNNEQVINFIENGLDKIKNY